MDDAPVPPPVPRGANPAGGLRARRPRRRRRGDPRALVRHRRTAHGHDHPPRAAGAGSGVAGAGGLGAAAPGPASQSRPGRVRGRRPHRARRPRAATPRPGRRRARRHPRVPRPHAQGMPVGDVVRVPVGGVHRAVPRAVLRRLVRAVRHAPGLRRAPARAAGPPTTVAHGALGVEVTGPPERTADVVRGVPRRAPGDHPSRSTHRAGVAHQPGGDAAVGAQRPRRLRRDRPLPRTHVVTRARRSGHRIHRRFARPGARAPRALRRLHAGPSRCGQRVCTPRSAVRSHPTPHRRCATTSCSRPKDQHGAHEYSFADLHLDPDAERERFARYQRHFSVPEEPAR